MNKSIPVVSIFVLFTFFGAPNKTTDSDLFSMTMSREIEIFLYIYSEIWDFIQYTEKYLQYRKIAFMIGRNYMI